MAVHCYDDSTINSVVAIIIIIITVDVLLLTATFLFCTVYSLRSLIFAGVILFFAYLVIICPIA